MIGGAGSGTAVYRRLQRSGIPFATGVLWKNDLYYPSAKALAVEVVDENAFCRIRPERLQRAKELVDECREVICTLGEDLEGGFCEELKERAEYAGLQGKLKTYV